MPRLMLIQPTQYDRAGRLCKQRRIYLPGLALPLLAAMAPRHWEVDIRLEVIEDIPFDAEVDLVGIGTMGYATWRAVEIAREFRRRGRIVFLGGYMASLVPEHTLEHVDSVVVGDGEISFPMLLQDYERTGRLQPIYRHPVEDLSGLPLPRYELLTGKPIGDRLPVQAGRGCPHLCSFCSIACLYRGRYLARPLPEVLRDIRRVRELGFRKFYLLDDNIVSNPGFLEELCDAIIPWRMEWASQCSLQLARNPRLLRKVRQAGCTMMSFGLESITQEGLDRLNKNWLRVEEHEDLLRRISEAGIMPSTEMMVGTDGDTEQSIRATADFVERARIPIPRFYILTPMPGTPLYQEMKDQGRLLTEDWRQYDGSTAVHRPARIAPERLTDLYWWLNQRVFRLWSILRRTVFRREFLRSPMRHLFALVVNLHYRRYVYRRVPPNIF